MAEFEHTKSHDLERSFITYGTLAPGRPNHFMVEHIRGTWKKGIIRGKLANKGWGAELGYYGFTPVNVSEQEEIEVFVLLSDELAENWERLDAFEGAGYRRIAVQYELNTGETGVGYLYAINE
ncbi:gamma-glutamylcyclotransferase family protein [Spirosoma linguale]|uniref:AIG2 family protein n=1 Tax=Spirosoma linguale (strain ATCC 33905 / DSM 74 / LMG 10896 / Claus 1) TaxID=504472 RepID=D2QN68_SPILD|nr:AIG2 family protein [Spirosoma linguale DSM 74]